MSRKRICLLGAPLENYYSCQFWKGATTAAAELGYDLVYLAGGLQRTYFAGFTPEAARNEHYSSLLYQMADPSQFDGVLVWGAQWQHHTNEPDLVRMLDHFAGLPIVSVGWANPRVHALLPDNYTGMRQLTTHLIQDHGHRRLAFLKSSASFQHWEMEQRFQGYCDALAHHGLDLDPRLIVYGYEIEAARNARQRLSSKYVPWGDMALIELLDGRGLVPGRDFTALVVRDDEAAIAAMRELERRGFRVPTDVAVVGCDDITSGRTLPLALTTVPQSFLDQAVGAMHLLADLMAGRPVPPVTSLPNPPPILRESCGCPNAHLRIALGNWVDGKIPPANLAVILARLEVSLREVLAGRGRFSDLLDEIEAGLTELRETGSDPLELADLISQIATRVEPADQQLVHALLIFIGDRAQRFRQQEHDATRELQNELDLVNRDIFRTYNLDQVLDAFEAELPLIGADGCALVLFGDPEQPLDTVRVLYSSLHGERRTDGGPDAPLFSTRALFSRAAWPVMNEPRVIYAAPLVFSDHRLGCLILEGHNSDGRDYSGVAVRLASSLEGAFIVRNLHEKQAELEKAYAEILTLSERDTLTGLYNRRAFQREIINEKNRMERYAQRELAVFSILFIDLDNFKHYNDRYGHAVGDATLMVFAQLLNASVRSIDLISRFGGDEFIILLPETPLPGATSLAERIIARVHDINWIHKRIEEIVGIPIEVEPGKQLTCSIGVAVYQSGDTTEGVIQRADQALYVAKSSGRNRYVISERNRQPV